MHSVRQFELVKVLATHRHFGRAAAALRISQPALTRSLKHRERRTVRLNRGGFQLGDLRDSLPGEVIRDAEALFA
jgi:hypothetical protein